MKRLTVIAILLSAACACAQEGMYESFEGGIPDAFSAARPQSLSRSDAHFKHGMRSLRWEWRAGEALEVAHGVGDVGRTGGYGGYHKAAFGLWLYCEEPVEGVATVQFEAAGEVGGSFRFPLSFSGWRRAVLHYRWGEEFDGTVPADTDTIRILAPDAGEGALFVDLVVYNGLIDYRRACIPEQAFAWEPVDPAEVNCPRERPETLSAAQERGLAEIAQALDPGGQQAEPIAEERMDEFREGFAALGIVRDERGIRGQPLVVSPGLYETAGVPDPPPTPSGLATFMRDVAGVYHATSDDEQRARLAEWYVLMADHLADQGFVAGSGNGWGGYAGRRLADAMFWMRRVMRENGRGAREAAFFDYNWGVSRILDADAPVRASMDRFGITEPRRLRGAMMQPDPRDRVQWVGCFSDRVSREVLHEGDNGFKPDGSAWHHGAHYFAYASYTVPVFVGVVAALDDTPWELSEDALARLKLYLMNLRFYGNLLDVPFSMHGRHPFSGGRIRASMYRQMAQAGPGEGEADFDPELAAAHLRLLAEEPEEPPFEGRDVTAEAPPQGSLTMPYAGITAHRRDDWLVCAHGFGRYFWGTEIYANVNAFGAFIGAGALTILRGGEPISLAGSGYVAEGWDWARFDGTTAPDLPLDELRNPKNGTQHTRTSHTFAGGLTHRGMHGCLVHRTEGPEWVAPGLRAHNTYFLFGDRVIALGSGIAGADAEHPVLTNLFQRHLPEPELPIVADGEPLTGIDVERDLPRDRASWMIDTVGTGFLVTAGQSVHVARRHQLSRDKDDTKDTEGDFASAWIDHGTAPEGGAYEYAVVMNATHQRMAALAEAADAGDAPWRVLRRDERAHIVRDEPTGITACVLFEAGEVEAALPVTAVDRPCLLMLEAEGDGWWLSVSDADLNLEDHVSVPRELRVTLRGRWRVQDAPDEMRAAETTEAFTTLTVRCHDGAGFTCRLVPAR